MHGSGGRGRRVVRRGAAHWSRTGLVQGWGDGLKAYDHLGPHGPQQWTLTVVCIACNEGGRHTHVRTHNRDHTDFSAPSSLRVWVRRRSRAQPHSNRTLRQSTSATSSYMRISLIHSLSGRPLLSGQSTPTPPPSLGGGV